MVLAGIKILAQYYLLDRMTRVVDRNGYATIYEYDANGNRTAVHYANGFTTTYDYDLLNRLIKQETVDIDGEIVVQYIYTLGVAGERLSVSELGRTVEYAYDSLYRLTSETITEGERVTAYTYAYDNVSNRILKTENGANTTYTYNAINQLVKENDTVYKYDDAGNLVSTTSSGKSAAYTYNAENKLIRATVNEAGKTVVEEYTYDYAGNRTSKTTGTETVKYLNDNSILTNVLAEIDANGNELCYYTIGTDLISQERSGKTSLYLYDGHGSVRDLVDQNAKVTDTYNYDAFGNLIDKTGTTVNNYLYCGEQFDSATGLYYLRARYMNPTTGTFISMDTYQGSIFEPATLHKYLYANANPVTYCDPSGYSAENDIDFYQQAWITIDQAIEYEHKLLGSMSNEVAYDYNVMQIGREIIHQLRNTGLEYAITYALEPYVGPDIARLIANGIVTGLDMALSSRNKAVSDNSGITNNSSGDPFLPDEYYKRKIDTTTYWQEPNTIQVFTREGSRSHSWETSVIISDDYGRIKYRIDFSDHAMPSDHSNPHIHVWEVNAAGTNYHDPDTGLPMFHPDSVWYKGQEEPSPINFYLSHN